VLPRPLFRASWRGFGCCRRKGMLLQAATRGDGETGEDVTKSAVFIKVRGAVAAAAVCVCVVVVVCGGGGGLEVWVRASTQLLVASS